MIKTTGTETQDWVSFFRTSERNVFYQSIGNRRLIELIFENTPKGGRVMEAGCGTALLSFILADCGYRLTAVDLTEEVIDYAKKRLAVNHPRVELRTGDILKLAELFEENHFDVVCSSGVMEHFSDEDIVKSLSEQRKIAKKVIFNVPNIRTKPTDKHIGDERFLSNSKWLSLIERAGFKKVKVFGGYDLPVWMYFVLPGAFFNRRASFWWKYFSMHSIFLCEQ